jgi:hypothetical protein
VEEEKRNEGGESPGNEKTERKDGNTEVTERRTRRAQRKEKRIHVVES